jgi:SAM-dependent methyltransferase
MSLARDLGRYFLRPRMRFARELRRKLAGKYGLEIGGPSVMFSWSGRLPVYPFAGCIDNVDFSEQTVWTNSNPALAKFNRRIIAEASELPSIPNSTYDFLMSSHALEHIANPLRALAEWKRVLKPHGALILVLPDKRFTFDRQRPITPLAHMIEDFQNNVGEDDLTHAEETLALSPHGKGADPAERRREILRNSELRMMHHHTFVLASAVELLEYAGFQVVHGECAKPFHIVTVSTQSQ